MVEVSSPKIGVSRKTMPCSMSTRFDLSTNWTFVGSRARQLENCWNVANCGDTARAETMFSMQHPLTKIRGVERIRQNLVVRSTFARERKVPESGLRLN